MNNRRLDEKKLKEIKMKASRQGGPGSRFAGFKEKPKNTKKTIKQLLKYISFSKPLLILLIIFTILSTVCTLSTNIVMKNVVGSLGIFNSDLKQWEIMPDVSAFKNYIILLACIYITYCTLSYFSSLVGSYLAVGMTKKMRNDLFKKIVKFPIKYTDTHPHGDIMSRMTNDVDNIANAVSSSITSLVSGLLTIIGCLTIMIIYSPLLTLVSLITLALSMTLTFLMSKFMGPLFTKQQSILGLLNSQTEEMVTGCKTVIAYNHQDTAKKEFNHFSDRLRTTGIKAQIWGGSMGPIMNFVGNIGYFLVCFFLAIKAPPL